MKTTIILLILTFACVNLKSQSLLLDLPFNGNVNDQSTYNQSVTIHGQVAPANNRFGTPNAAYFFNGDTLTYIEVANTADFNFNGNDAFSISLWYQGGSKEAGDYEIMLEKEDAFGLALYDVNQVNFRVTTSVSDPNQPWNQQLWHFVSYNWDWLELANAENEYDTLGEWHHVVGVYENNTILLYVDDTLRGTDTDAVTIPNTQNLIIGKNFFGHLDDIKVYNTALSPSEIHDLFVEDDVTNISFDQVSKKSYTLFYPNPVHEKLHLIDPGAFKQINIMNANGKKVQEVKQNTSSLDLSKMASGVYFIEFITDGRSITKKFIKE